MESISLEKIETTPGQPRKTFYKESLEELAASIKERGVLEPIIVRPIADGKFQLVIGERRFRASHIAGLTEIPAIVRDLTDEEAATDALLENYQREDLNPIERARAVKDLMQFISAAQCCKALGVKEPTLRKYLELLELPHPIQQELIGAEYRPGENPFTEGHARAIKVLNKDPGMQLRVVRKIKKEKISIEETTKLITAMNEFPAKTEAFLQVSLSTTEEILRHFGRTAEKTKPFKPQTAETKFKAILKETTLLSDILDDRLTDHLSNEQMNQLLGAVSVLSDQLEKFRSKVRKTLTVTDLNFKEIHINCPLCGRIELVGSVRCSVCWTVLKRCSDCELYDTMYQRCKVTGNNIYLSDANSPDERSVSYRCDYYKPKWLAKVA